MAAGRCLFGRGGVCYCQVLPWNAGRRRQASESPRQLLGLVGRAQFFFDALPGPPEQLLVDGGDQQVGIAGHTLPEPLLATVTDTAFNRLQGVPVTFRVIRGEGIFIESGSQELSVLSDREGRTAAFLILGSARRDHK